MKKRNLTSLKLNKKQISTFKNDVLGGWIYYTRQFPNGGNNCPASHLPDACAVS